MRATALAMLVAVGCSSGPGTRAQASSPVLDIAPALGPGTYQLTITTATRIATLAQGAAEAEITTHGRLEVARSGSLAVGALRWTETIERVVIAGDKRWDSQTGEAPAIDWLESAALAGAHYQVELKDGDARIRDLSLPMPAITREQRQTLEADAKWPIKASELLAARAEELARRAPRQRARVGDSWPAELGAREVAATWTLTAANAQRADLTLRGSGSDPRGAEVTISGSARYRIDSALVERSSFRSHTSDARFELTRRVELTLEPLTPPSGAAPAPTSR